MILGNHLETLAQIDRYAQMAGKSVAGTAWKDTEDSPGATERRRSLIYSAVATCCKHCVEAKGNGFGSQAGRITVTLRVGHFRLPPQWGQ